MCGIVGFTGSDKEKILRLNKLIKHRGPNQEGVFVDDKVSLGHRRLSIIDLSDAGFQPMFYDKENGASSEKYHTRFLQNSNLCMVFNGEIYNFEEIREELITKNYTFTSNCDSEVLMAAYLEWGTKCVKRFNGMWAFCIYDKVKNILFLSRDRIGIKPLYYYFDNNKFIFGSELKLILKSVISKQINKEALNYYLVLGLVPRHLSMLENTFQVLPAHNLIYDLTSKKIVQVEKYWECSYKTTITDSQEAQNKIIETFDKSVKRRLIADVPVGAFLSGGVDSSAIVHFMRKYIKNLKTFSIKFDHADYDESQWAKTIADKYQTEHHQIKFSAKDVVELVPKLVDYYDEPLGDSSMIPTFLLAKVASEHVTVCLSGTGGDELFGGYARHAEILTLEKLLNLPKALKDFLVFGYSFVNKDKSKKLAQLLKTNQVADCYIKLFSHMFRDDNELEVDEERLKELNKYFSYNSTLSNVLNFDTAIYLPDDLLIKEDRATMAHSMEGRVPFLDHELVELANRISSDLKIQKGETKSILKKALEPYLSNEILYRKKQGFGVPLAEYFRNELKGFAYTALFDFDDFNYYDKKLVKRFWDNHQNKTSDYSALFWVLMMFNLWYQKYMLD